MSNPNVTRVIRRLDEVVVNRIAAGEVIQRPANALKELLENCLDAKSTRIQITVKDGGLKLLQIQDNGSGIRKEDMDIVCERFTTSKLEKYDDLGTLSTYGFRGEALASITHVAHVTITTRTADSKCAYRGSYSDGKLKEALKPCAGNVGTQISVEDLFFNVATRRRALKSPTEEHQKIADVVTKYAVHNASVGFLLKKLGDVSSDVNTPVGSTQLDNIRIVYGPAIARELLEVMITDNRLSFQMKGLVSNGNYSTKKPSFLLFINHRLVDSTSLRKAIDSVYSSYLPKHTHPFVYLSLEINPKNIDVNVHPTKHEVHFLNEEAIVEVVQRAIDARLLGANTSRTFYVQGMLPSAAAVAPVAELLDAGKAGQQAKISANQFVRTDCKERKLDVFLSRVQTDSTSVSKAGDGANSLSVDTVHASSVFDSTSKNETLKEHDEKALDDNSKNSIISRVSSADASNIDVLEEIDINVSSVKSSNYSEKSSDSLSVGSTKGIISKRSANYLGNNSNVSFASEKTQVSCSDSEPVKLSSVLQLRAAVVERCHAGLRELLANHTFCGCVSPELALVQHQTKLYLVNTARLTQEFFYQKILKEFSNLGVMRLSERAPLYDLAMMALDLPDSGWTSSDGTKEELSEFIVNLLSSKAEMLRQYFSLEIDTDDRTLCSLPLLLDGYTPCVEGLPMYILRLATEVDWDSELECFQSFARETALFYSISNEWWLMTEEEEMEGVGGDDVSGGEKERTGGGEERKGLDEAPISCVQTKKRKAYEGDKGEEMINAGYGDDDDCSLIYNEGGGERAKGLEVCTTHDDQKVKEADDVEKKSLGMDCTEEASHNLTSSFSESVLSMSIDSEMTSMIHGSRTGPVRKTAHKTDWRWTIEHIVYPALRLDLVPPKKHSEDGTFLQIANLPDLYKVFERC